jgi:hypothetical protein
MRYAMTIAGLLEIPLNIAGEVRRGDSDNDTDPDLLTMHQNIPSTSECSINVVACSLKMWLEFDSVVVQDANSMAVKPIFL